MPSIQVRDCPPDLYRNLQKSAQQEHRSISQQIVATLEAQLSEDSLSTSTCDNRPQPYDDAARSYSPRDFSESERQTVIRQRKALFAEIDALPHVVIPDGFPSPDQIVRELRDSR